MNTFNDTAPNGLNKNNANEDNSLLNQDYNGKDLVELGMDTGFRLHMDQKNLQGTGSINMSANLSWPSIIRVLSLLRLLKKWYMHMKLIILQNIENENI